MKKKIKNILITGASSDIAQWLIKKLLEEGVCVYAISRSNLEINDDNLKKFNFDLTLENEIQNFFSNLNNITFDGLISFQGVAISSPVECLKKEELQKQLDISLFSLLYILKNVKPYIKKDGIIVNISSMASYGIFPFLSPYSISKASSDILLNCFEIETGIKTVSVKPGVVGTKFWKFCIEENRQNFENFKDNYKSAGDFLKTNALKNSNKGLKSDKVSKLIYNILYAKNPKSSYLIGLDARLCAFVSNFKGRLLNKIIKFILDKRIKGCKK